MRIKAYNILERAIEEGIAYGYRRAHKHTDNPTEEQIKQAMIDGVINEICEVIDFETDTSTVMYLHENKTVL